MSKHNEFTVANFLNDLERGRYVEIALRGIYGNNSIRLALLHVLATATNEEVNGVEKALAFLICPERRALWYRTHHAEREALIR